MGYAGSSTNNCSILLHSKQSQVEIIFQNRSVQSVTAFACYRNFKIFSISLGNVALFDFNETTNIFYINYGGRREREIPDHGNCGRCYKSQGWGVTLESHNCGERTNMFIRSVIRECFAWSSEIWILDEGSSVLLQGWATGRTVVKKKFNRKWINIMW